MLSKRKRELRCRQESARDLLSAYQTKQIVSREGSHTVLRWLVLSQQYSIEPSARCPLSAANIDPHMASVQECQHMEQQAVSVAESCKESYVVYAAHFFKWWFHIAQVTQLPARPASPNNCPWLSLTDLQRSLVVPDVRRSAIKIAQMLEIRAGERESIPNKSYSSALQTLRTSEWNVSMHQTIMYGTATQIYHKGFLNSVYIAIVDGRYRGRLNFKWVDCVISAPARPNEDGAWPSILVHGTHFIVLWKGKQTVCHDFPTAYCTWVQICLDEGGIVAGRYNVTKCM